MSISLLPELEARRRERAEAEGLSLEGYLDRIARDDEAAEAELQALALEGLQSGDPVPADGQYWEEKRKRLLERHRRTGAQ